MAKKVFVNPTNYVDWFTVSPSDSVNIVDDSTNNPKGYQLPCAIYATGAGNIVCVSSSGVVKTFAMTAGQILPLAPLRVNSTSTTATGLIGLISATAQ